GNLLAGGAGVEYYFGYQRDHDDLESETWEARDQMWQYNKHALFFFNNHIPFWQMEPADDLIGNGNNSNSRYCLAQDGEVYAIYLPDGSASFSLDLQGVSGSFDVKWFDPRNGGALLNGSSTSVAGGSSVSLGTPPNNPGEDWVILVKKNGNGGGNPIPPVVSLSAPLNAATFTVGSPITIAAIANDPDGSISKVDFYAGQTLIGSDVTAPYSMSWTGATAGSYSISAKATDNDGLSTTSLAVNISVSGSGGGGSGSCPAPFEEVNGMVVVEAESVPAVGDWNLETSIPGYTGSGYYVWDGSDYFNNPGNGLLEYKINITTTGTYRFQWRNRITQGTSTSDFNDNWLRFPDASDFWAEKGGNKVYPKGTGKTPNPAGSSSDGWFKVYVSELNKWSWQTRTSDGNPHEIYVKFDTPGVYTMQVSARSKGHGIDRMVLFHSSVNSTTALDPNQAETKCAGGGPTTVPPSVALASPQPNASFTAGDDITLTATATDSDGTVSKVDFYHGGLNLIGTASAIPYS
ncbi:MAG: Ig-like domain-containing protein, partial [Bacteroidota bacterium]